MDIPETAWSRATFHASSPWDDCGYWVSVDGILEAQAQGEGLGLVPLRGRAARSRSRSVSHYISSSSRGDAQTSTDVTFERTGDIPTWPFPGQGTTPTSTVTGTVTPTLTEQVT